MTTDTIRVGDIVKYADGWYTPGEEKYRLLVLESYEDVKRCLVLCINSILTIKPTETLDWEMVTPTDDIDEGVAEWLSQFQR